MEPMVIRRHALYVIFPKPNFYLRGDYFLQQATESKYSVHFILSWKKAKHETKL